MDTNEIKLTNMTYEEEEKAKALALLKFVRFPSGGPGTVITRNGRKYLVTKSGAQKRIE